MTTRASAEDVIKNVRAENYDMFNISGLVISDSDMTGRTIGGVKVVANMQNVSKIIINNWDEEVNINMETRTEYPQELVDDLVEMGVVVHFNLYNIENVAGNRHAVERLGNYTVLTSSMNYATNKQAFAKRRYRRMYLNRNHLYIYSTCYIYKFTGTYLFLTDKSRSERTTLQNLQIPQHVHGC